MQLTPDMLTSSLTADTSVALVSTVSLVKATMDQKGLSTSPKHWEQISYSNTPPHIQYVRIDQMRYWDSL